MIYILKIKKQSKPTKKTPKNKNPQPQQNTIEVIYLFKSHHSVNQACNRLVQ